ncbi:MAG TPA: hypothetical protein VHI96_09900 [Solirubrobacterales bacterium]|jgi:hypothetical protein|nr:hypothetical protein [Solirubrobacterales bacterium]
MSGTERDLDEEAGRGRKPDPAPPRQAGVLGNLPKKRPAVRSPRRTEAQAPPGKSREKPPARAAAPPKPEAQSAPQGGSKPVEEAEHSNAADLEGLARGGIAIAAGAASLGLRIAGRTAAALRDAVERR